MSDRMSTGQSAINLRVLRRAVRQRDLDPNDDQRTLLFLADIVDELLRANDKANHAATGAAIAKLREAVRYESAPAASEPPKARDTLRVNGHHVWLDGNELAMAIDAHLAANQIKVAGARTIRIKVDGDAMLCRDVEVSVASDKPVNDGRQGPAIDVEEHW